MTATHQILARFAPLALALFAGCAAPAARSTISADARILELPFLEQDEMYACGLASVQALCSYWNVSIDPAEEARLAQLANAEQGLSGAELRSALEGLGFETFLFHGALNRSATGLFEHIDKQRPALVMLAPTPEARHYVLFIGYDATERNVCVLDPVRGRVLLPYETFEAQWEPCDRFTLLAVPRATPSQDLDTKADRS